MFTEILTDPVPKPIESRAELHFGSIQSAAWSPQMAPPLNVLDQNVICISYFHKMRATSLANLTVLILTTLKILIKNINYGAHRYVIFSILLLFRPPESFTNDCN